MRSRYDYEVCRYITILPSRIVLARSSPTSSSMPHSIPASSLRRLAALARSRSVRLLRIIKAGVLWRFLLPPVVESPADRLRGMDLPRMNPGVSCLYTIGSSSGGVFMMRFGVDFTGTGGGSISSADVFFENEDVEGELVGGVELDREVNVGARPVMAEMRVGGKLPVCSDNDIPTSRARTIMSWWE